LGELLAIGSAVAWALTSVAMRPVIASALWSSSLLRLLVCTVLLAAYAIPTGVLERAAAAPPEAWFDTSTEITTSSTITGMVRSDRW